MPRPPPGIKSLWSRACHDGRIRAAVSLPPASRFRPNGTNALPRVVVRDENL
jgi:hypothetical protein